MTTEEEFITELEKYIQIQPKPNYQGAGFTFENIAFVVKATDAEHIVIYPLDVVVAQDCETVSFGKNPPEKQKDGVWFFSPYCVFGKNDYENNSIGNLNTEDAEKLKKTLRKAYENGKK